MVHYRTAITTSPLSVVNQNIIYNTTCIFLLTRNAFGVFCAIFSLTRISDETYIDLNFADSTDSDGSEKNDELKCSIRTGTFDRKGDFKIQSGS